MKAPVCTIIGYDLDFYEYLPKLFPHTDAKSWFEGDEQKIFDTAFRNGTLQGAYLIMAARALGLDTGPMSGFDNAGVDRNFSPGPASNRTSCAISAMATARNCSRARRASTSTRWRRSSKKPS
jgi:nitroreductase